MTTSVREDIMEYLETLMKGMQAGQPVLDPYQTTWSMVTREDIGKLVAGKANALGIYDTEETKTVRSNYVTECLLRVVFEFHLRIAPADRPSKQLGILLTDLERKVLEDQTLGGKAIDVVLLSNDKDIDGPYDRQVQGALFVNIRYRHKTTDPREVI